MKLLLSFLLIILSIGPSCNKEKFKIDFSGYTPTDISGNIIGTIDPTDWTFDASWSNKELDIFSQINAGNLSGTSVGTVSVIPAYPNPCSSTFSLVFQATSSCNVRVAIVNDELDNLGYQVFSLQAGFNQELFSLPPTSKRGKLYRMYYIFDAEGNPAFKKGHGDIMLQ